MKKFTLLIFFFLFFSLISIIPFSNNVNATILGNYYVCDFTGISDGTQNLSVFDDGINWANMKWKSGTVSVLSQSLDFNSNANDKIYFNITRATTFFSFKIKGTLGATETFSITLLNPSGSQEVRLSADSVNTHFYDNNNTEVMWYAGQFMGVSAWVYINFTAIPTNDTFYITTSIGNWYVPAWVSFSETFNVLFYSSVNTAHIQIDDLMILSTTPQSPWEISSQTTFGSVLATPTNYTLSLTAGEQYDIIEHERILSSGNLYVTQFALPLSTTNDLSKFSLVLHLNGYDCGYYDNLYLSNNRYILVWKNINLSFVQQSNILIEILITGITMPTTFTFMAYTGDIDNDGIIEFKWSNGIYSVVLPYWNSLYDGISTSSISEFQYKIWGNYSSGIYNCGYDVDKYNYIGEYIDSTQIAVSHFVEMQYTKKITSLLRFFEFYVGSQTIVIASQTSDYYLKINGIPKGSADCIQEINSNWYKVLWNISYLSNNESILFEVSCPSAIIIASRVDFDIDNDGTTEYKYHNSYNLWNGIFDGTSGTIYKNWWDIFGSNKYYELAYRLYYENLTFNFDNMTSIYPDLITSTATEFNQYDLVPIYCFMSVIYQQNTVEIWRDGIQMATQDFPYAVPLGTFSDELSFMAFNTGNYSVKLVRGGSVKSIFNFTVLALSDDDYIIRAYPNPTDLNAKTNVFYRYFSADGSDGLIGISTNENESISFSNLWDISANTTGNVTFYPQSNVYVSLWKKVGVTYSRVAIDYLSINSKVDNTINILYSTFKLGNGINSFTQSIYGTQNIKGFNVFIRLNGKNIGSATGEESYYINTEINKIGNYLAELCMETQNGSIVLCSVSFSVTSYSGSGDGDNALFDIITPYKLYIGIFIVVLFTLIPLIVGLLLSSKTNISVMDIPSLVYVAFFLMGIVINCVLGFFELWVIFFVLFALVLVFAITWINGKSDSGG